MLKILSIFFTRSFSSPRFFSSSSLSFQNGPLYWNKKLKNDTINYIKPKNETINDTKLLAEKELEEIIIQQNAKVVNEYIQKKVIDHRYSPLQEDFDDLSYKKSLYNLEKINKRLFFPGDIDKIIKPNWFRRHFRSYYVQNLNVLLKDNHIYSCIFKAYTDNGEYQTLGPRFGYLFNHDELMNWNFTKSVYYNLIHKCYFQYIDNIYEYNKKMSKYNQLSQEERQILISPLFLYSFDYYFRLHNAPLNLDQFFIRICQPQQTFIILLFVILINFLPFASS